jgi:hypothetical protein
VARKKDIERAPIVCTRTRNGLSPVSAFEAELLDRYPIGAELEISIKQRRSLPQLKTYWKMLSTIVEATDEYPSAEHLHEALKLHMGYVTPLIRLDGKQEYVPDSTAFAAMDGAEFKVFMDRAVRTLAERFQLDPLSFMTETERRAA